MNLQTPPATTHVDAIQSMELRINAAELAAIENPTEKTIANLEAVLAESRAFRASLKKENLPLAKKTQQ